MSSPDRLTKASRRRSARQFDRPIVSRLRRLCLALPGTDERASWGHPNFRAGKRTFVSFEVFKGQPAIAFRLDPASVDRYLRGRQFFSTPYGRGQWVSMRADGRVNWALVARLVDRSYRTIATKRMVESLDRRLAAGS
jgi:predicted DNA-binding protein (MmcQ/YjbR family)